VRLPDAGREKPAEHQKARGEITQRETFFVKTVSLVEDKDEGDADGCARQDQPGDPPSRGRPV
jgi:hypothetical protein